MAKSKMSDADWCAFPSCRKESDVIWLGVGLCSHHNQWKNDNTLERAYKKLSIKQEHISQNVYDEKIVKNKKGLGKFITEEN